MPGMDGIAATRQLTERTPGVQVVVLTSFIDRDRVVDALAAGAIGYVLKDAGPRSCEAPSARPPAASRRSIRAPPARC